MSAGIIPDNDFFRERFGYISGNSIRSIRFNRLNEGPSDDTAYYFINELVKKGMLVDAVQPYRGGGGPCDAGIRASLPGI